MQCRVRRHPRLGAVLVAMVISCAAPSLLAQQVDVVVRAAELSAAGQRDSAIALLREALVASPDSQDVRVRLATILSWEGRYDEARREIGLVLAGSPTHGDALLAGINIELWSSHPGEAEVLARRGLQQRPTDSNYLAANARALVALNRHTDARLALERLLALDPRNEQGAEIRRLLQQRPRAWQARVGTSHDSFSDRDSWRESQVSVGRTTPFGSVLVKGLRAERFGLTDHQVEVEMYPRLREGTYAYVAGAWAPDGRLYPQYRYAVELYQSLGAGFEASAGYRRLSFGNGVNIYVVSINKYYGQWLLTGRTFATPDSAGTARSYHGAIRRYVGNSGAYVGARYGRGGWREELRDRDDLDVLDSDALAADGVVMLGSRLELSLSGSYSREDRVDRLDLRQYSFASGLGLRF